MDSQLWAYIVACKARENLVEGGRWKPSNQLRFYLNTLETSLSSFWLFEFNSMMNNIDIQCTVYSMYIPCIFKVYSMIFVFCTIENRKNNIILYKTLVLSLWGCLKGALPSGWHLVRRGRMLGKGWVNAPEEETAGTCWNPKMEVWKTIFLFKGVIFRFHIGFQGSIFWNNSSWFALPVTNTAPENGLEDDPASFWGAKGRFSGAKWLLVSGSVQSFSDSMQKILELFWSRESLQQNSEFLRCWMLDMSVTSSPRRLTLRPPGSTWWVGFLSLKTLETVCPGR